MDKKIYVSKNIGFCPGVKRTINLIENILKEKKYKKIYMLGEVIHNSHVINDLKKRGLKLITDFNKIPKIKDGILIIQSHGISPQIYETLKKKKINYIDSTCPLVKIIHNAIKKLENEGFYPLIIGNRYHTEVIGISGYTKNKPIIINKKEEVKKSLFKQIKKVGIVFQSTFIQEEGEKIIKEIKKYVNNIKVIDTICKPTKDRQNEIKEKSKKYKSIIVIGSPNSSNTKHLYKISLKNNKNTFFIENPEELYNIDFSNKIPILVTSGASAPDYIIEKVIKTVEKLISPFNVFSQKYIPLIEKNIEEYFKNKKSITKISDSSYIINELKNFSLQEGKKIRPLLLILGFISFSKNKVTKNILKIAAAVEIMHNFLLIHDDIMDNDKIRRGKKSLHLLFSEHYNKNKKLGIDIALVSGDILFTNAIEIISEIKLENKIKDRFLKVFSKCYELTCWGQIFDSLYSNPLNINNINLKMPLVISEYKTAYYTIYYPLLMGYILSGRNNKSIIENLKKFAIPLGIAFQLRDDILGVFGKSEETGKSNISDIIEGKFTLLIKYTFEKLNPDEKDKFISLFLKRNKTLKEIKLIKEVIKNSGGLTHTLKKMKQYINSAKKRLQYLRLSSKKMDIFISLIHLIENLEIPEEG